MPVPAKGSGDATGSLTRRRAPQVFRLDLASPKRELPLAGGATAPRMRAA